MPLILSRALILLILLPPISGYRLPASSANPSEFSTSHQQSNPAFPKTLLALPSPTHLGWLTKHPDLLYPTRGSFEENARVILAIQVTRRHHVNRYWMSVALGASRAEVTNTSGTLYTSTGRHFTFASRKADLRSILVGPISDKPNPRPRTRDFDFLVNDDYLRLGLHRLHEFFDATQRFRAQFPEHEPIAYTIRSTPFEDETDLFPPEVIEAASLSEASERAFVGAIPALTEFFGIIYETDGLKDILLSLIPKSKLVKLLLPFSDAQIRFQYGDPLPFRSNASALELGISAVGVVPIQVFIGNEPMLQLNLYTTEPAYEWQACAGIVAASIQSIPDPDRKCVLRAFPAALLGGRITDADPSLE